MTSGLPTKEEIASLPGFVRVPVLLAAPFGRATSSPAADDFLAGSLAFLRSEHAPDAWKQGAKEGSPECAHNRGVALEYGFAGRRDRAAAIRYYRSAAAAGLDPAKNNLGLALLDEGGDHAARGLNRIENAVRGGDVTARCNLALLMLQGRIESRGERRPERLVETAAQTGHPAALFILGVLRYNGRARSPGAFETLSRSAAAGYPPALYRLAGLQAWGDGCKADSAKARDLVTRAAELGVEAAQRRLAHCHATGTDGYARSAVAALAYLSLLDLDDDEVLLRDTLAGRLPKADFAEAMRHAAAISLRAPVVDALWYNVWLSGAGRGALGNRATGLLAQRTFRARKAVQKIRRILFR